MVDIDEVRTRFRDECLTAFSADGFKYFKKREAFRRKASSEFEHLAHFRVVKTSRVLIEPSFSIRQLEVEGTFHEAMGTAKKFADMTSVLWPHAATLVPDAGEEIVFQVDSEESVVDGARAFAAIYRDYARTFFELRSSLDEIDRILNGAPLEPCAYQPSLLHRCSFGAVVALMLHGKENAAATVEAHRNVLATLNDGFYLPKFDRVVDAVLFA